MRPFFSIFIFVSIISLLGCSEDGLSDADRPLPSRNAKLNVTVESCGDGVCNPLSGKIVNIYEYEDEAMGFEEGIRLVATDTSGIASFGFVELSSVYVTVRHNGILDISQVSLPKNSISHHLVTFSM